uniref:Uncharacterized protein n=2 Tax=Hordeum vulgare subsp. vulgare TaxID=112509 RepID=A0A8I7B3Y4_HORVV
MENTTSPQSSCTSQPASAASSMSAGESSWAMHFANFVASTDNRQEMDHQGGEASESDFSSGFSSSFDSLGDGSDTDSFLTSDLMDEDDEDDSLQDTACSSAARPKVTSMHDMFMKSIVNMDTKEMNTAQLAKYFLDAAGSRQQATGAVQEVISGGNSNEKQLHEFNDLRKKGLCLVPLSMLIDYLG